MVVQCTHMVRALAVFSVEGVYYHPEIQRRVAERHADTTGEDVEECISEAKSAALKTISPHIQRLSERAAEKRVREAFFDHIAGKEQISVPQPVNVSIDVPKIVGQEKKAYPVDSGRARCSVATAGWTRTRGLEGLNSAWRGGARLPSFRVRFPMRRVARHSCSRVAGPGVSPARLVARLALSR